ncbi:hypothetical protein KUV89_16935 [Marinobacter hydrocarbonoclasticus]|nr:hypothetical protein [Marinobacter nauticus]
MDYESLNNAVNHCFFDKRYEDKPVYLDLDEPVKEELATILCCQVEEVEVIIGKTISESLVFNGGNVYSYHKDRLTSWKKSRRKNFPPFTCLLLSFSLAAEKMRHDGEHSSNNYYNRLFQLLRIGCDFRQNIIRDHCRDTLLFWQELNNWLVDNEYSYGIPTAKQVNSWRYVSYAISQSLIRDCERSHLRKMLDNYGIKSDDQLSSEEAYLYIDQWMSSSAPTDWLRRLWNEPDLQERIISATIAEIPNLGVSRHRNRAVERQRNLIWVISRRKGLKPKVKFFLTAPVQFEGPVTFKEAHRLKGIFSSTDFSLEAPLGSQLALLGPQKSMNLAGLLIVPFKLTAHDGTTLVNRSRPIVPFARPVGGNEFREVSRVSFLKEHLVLCHERWVCQVEAHLEKYAAEGFVKKVGGTKYGVPDGWVLFENVYIVNESVEKVHDSLQTLMPLSSTARIEFEGGLQLQHNTWHADYLPNVTAMYKGNLASVELQRQGVKKSGRIIASSQGNVGKLVLSDVELGAVNGHFSLVAKSGKSIISECAVSVRTADQPRIRATNKEQLVVYPLVSEGVGHWDMNGIVGHDVRAKSPCLRGMVLTNVARVEPLRQGLKFCAKQFDEVSSGDSSHEYFKGPLNGVDDSCVMRGYHVWTVQPVTCLEDFNRDITKMKCNDCGLVAHSHLKDRKRARRKLWAGAPKPVNGQVVKPKNGLVVHSPDRALEINTVFDALCYLGSGTWASFEKIASHWVQDPWDCMQFANNLFDLGHIDLARDPATGKVTGWSMAPATIVITESGFSYLAGFRSKKLVADIKNALGEYKFNRQEQKSGPDLVCWKLDASNLGHIESLLSGIKTPMNKALKISFDPASQIANYFPSWEKSIEQATSLSAGSEEIFERFEPRTNLWYKSEVQQPGAYRTGFRGRTYFYRDVSGVNRVVGLEMVKVLAAREERLRLCRFMPDNGEFQGQLGCQPPALFRRALVACSGRLPSIEGPRLVYANVSPFVAEQVISKLYE